MKLTKFLLAIAIAIIFASCSKEEVSAELQSKSEKEITNQISKKSKDKDKTFFKENIAIVNAHVRKINDNSFVREVVLQNFSKSKWNKSVLGLNGFIFSDNGKNNDIIANDGIYTSVEKFEFNENVQFNSNESVKSVLESPIFSTEFLYVNELNNIYSENTSLSNKGEIGCDFKIVSTGCNADDVWEGFGCVELSNCSFKITW